MPDSAEVICERMRTSVHRELNHILRRLPDRLFDAAGAQMNFCLIAFNDTMGKKPVYVVSLDEGRNKEYLVGILGEMLKDLKSILEDKEERELVTLTENDVGEITDEILKL